MGAFPPCSPAAPEANKRPAVPAYDGVREASERRKLCTAILALMVIPPLFGGMAAFSPKPWAGLVVGLVCMPLVIAPLLALALRRPGSYRPSYGAALLLATNLSTVGALLVLPLAYWLPTSIQAMTISGTMLLVLMAGVLAGRYRLLPAKRVLAELHRRFVPGQGWLIIRARHRFNWGYRPVRPGDRVDQAIKAIAGMYALLVVLGAVLGGAAGLVILSVLAPFVPPDSALGPHLIAVLGLGFLLLPVLGYFHPALWRIWRTLRSIEEAAHDDAGGLTVLFDDR